MTRIICTLSALAISALILVPMGNSQPPNRELARIMEDKLKSSQALLEGIALADFDKIRASADKLVQLSKTAEWMVFKTPKYEVQSNEFRRTLEAIYQKAKDKNIEGVVSAYADMTRSCVRCHQYVRELREARAPLAPTEIRMANAR